MADKYKIRNKITITSVLFFNQETEPLGLSVG